MLHKKFTKMTSNSKKKRQNSYNTESRKTSFLKEYKSKRVIQIGFE